MSLFKLKNIWIESFLQEEFDQKHLCLGQIDGISALALASYSSLLRIYLMNATSNFKAQLIYQTKFDTPILSIQFVTHPEQRNNTLGVLLYRKFIYLTLKKNLTTDNYQTKNMPITVQPAFAIQPHSLSLMTLNSSIQYLNPISIQPIKVSDPIFPFARQQDCIYYGDGQQLVMMQNSVQQWRIIVGPMRSIHLFHSQIIIIGDNALWQIQQSQIIKTKVMEQDLSCGTIIQKTNDYNLIIANFSHQIFIYTSTYSLLWAIKSTQIPIKICIFLTSDLEGALALLGQQGTLSISFLGTELPDSQIQTNNDNIDIDLINDQIKNLEILIRNKIEQPKNVQHQQIIEKGDVKFNIKAKNPRKTEQILENNQLYFKQDGQLWCCQIQCIIKPQKGTIYDASISLNLPSNITCINKNLTFISIDATKRIQLTLFCSNQKFPFSNTIQLSLRYETSDRSTLEYISAQGSNIINQTCQLPFDFQCSFKNLQLEEKPTNKIIFKASNELPSIFWQLDTVLGRTKNFTITLTNGVLCSIGYNKNNNKIKIQSDLFSGLCYMFIVFNSRFDKLLCEKKIPTNQLTVDIPLEEFFNVMKDHHQLRDQIKQNSQHLAQKCQQFRSIQKKLIIKLKQKTSSLNNIDKLLQYTYKKLLQNADNLSQTKQQLDAVNHNLQIAIKFICQLLFMKTKATPKCRQQVLGIIGYQKQSNQFGWEQKVMSNSAYFLNKKFNYILDKYSFDQIYKTVLWVISKANSGEWNQ